MEEAEARETGRAGRLAVRAFFPASSHANFNSPNPQAKAVEAVVKDINARFGKGSIMFLNSEPEKM